MKTILVVVCTVGIGWFLTRSCQQFNLSEQMAIDAGGGDAESTALVEAALKQGASPNQDFDGTSALERAVKVGNSATIRVLLRYKADKSGLGPAMRRKLDSILGDYR